MEPRFRKKAVDRVGRRSLVRVFAKTVEPRTITCSCGHEDEYQQKDVGFLPLE